jgi:predicted MFS family arabinose efflux permease
MPYLHRTRQARRLAPTPWYLLGVALVIQLGFSSLDQGVTILTSFVKTDLGVSTAVAGLAVSSLLFGKMLGSYLGGSVADRLGEREVLVGGGAISALVIAIGLATPSEVLFPLLALAGFAAAAATPAGGRLILSAFPRDKRGLALGIRQTGVPIAGLIVALLLPPIARAAGWRWALATAALMMALSIIPLYRTSVPRTVTVYRPRFWSLARDQRLRSLTLWGALIVSGQFALIAYLAPDIHQTRGMSLASAGLLVAVAQVAGLAGRIGWGVLSDRSSAGRERLLFVLTLLGWISAALLFAAPRSLPFFALVLIILLAGFALIGFQGLWITLVAESAGPGEAGAATGFATTFSLAAVALTPPGYGLVADVFGTYRAVWGALAGVLLIAFIPAMRLRHLGSPSTLAGLALADNLSVER